MLIMVLYNVAVFYVVLIFWVCFHRHLVGVKLLCTSPGVSSSSFFPQRVQILKEDFDLFSFFLDLDSLTVNLGKKNMYIYSSHEYQCCYIKM